MVEVEEMFYLMFCPVVAKFLGRRDAKTFTSSLEGIPCRDWHVRLRFYIFLNVLSYECESLE